MNDILSDRRGESREEPDRRRIGRARRGPVTHNEIAQRLGLDRTTVCKVLRGIDVALSPETRELILLTADQMGYVSHEKRSPQYPRYIIPTPVTFSIELVDTGEVWATGNGVMHDVSVGGCLLGISSITKPALPLHAFLVTMRFLALESANNEDGMIGTFRHPVERRNSFSALGLQFKVFLGNAEALIRNMILAQLPPGCLPEEARSMPQGEPRRRRRKHAPSVHLEVELPPTLPDPAKGIAAFEYKFLREDVRRLAPDLTSAQYHIIIALRRQHAERLKEKGITKQRAARIFRAGVLAVIDCVQRLTPPSEVRQTKALQASARSHGADNMGSSSAPHIPAAYPKPIRVIYIRERDWLRRNGVSSDVPIETRKMIVAMRREAEKGCTSARETRLAREAFDASLPTILAQFTVQTTVDPPPS